MTWYRVHKIFRGGKSSYDYIEVPKYTRLDDVKNYAEDWADNTPGGHCYGWRVYWKKVRKPPKKWFRKKVEELETRIDSYKRYIENLKKRIERYKEST